VAQAAELARDGGDEFGRLDGGGVDADLLGAGLDEARRVVEGADAAADGERHEQFFRDAPHHIEHNRAALVAGADVEEHQLVGAVLLVAPRDLDGVAGVAQLEEVDALDDAAAVDVETGDDSFGEHRPAEVRFATTNVSTLRGPVAAVNASRGGIPAFRLPAESAIMRLLERPRPGAGAMPEDVMPETIPADTTLEAFHVQVGIFRRISPERRLAMVFEMSNNLRRVAAEGVRARHPDYDEDQARLAVIRLMLGEQLFRDVFPGVDVRV